MYSFVVFLFVSLSCLSNVDLVLCQQSFSQVCPNPAVALSCSTAFYELFAVKTNETTLAAQQSSIAALSLAQSIPCYDPALLGGVSAASPCLVELDPDSCNSFSPFLDSQETSLGLLCTVTGQLILFAWTPSSCSGSLGPSSDESDDILPLPSAVTISTAPFCTAAASAYINRTITCSSEVLPVSTLPSPSPPTIVIVDNNNILLDAAAITDGCLNETITEPPIGLLPNPIGPEAITAIVVLTCLAITAILATFFFWPKCHLSRSQLAAAQKAAALKKRKKASEPIITSTGGDLIPGTSNGYASVVSGDAGPSASEAVRGRAYGDSRKSGGYKGIQKVPLPDGDYEFTGGVGPSAA